MGAPAAAELAESGVSERLFNVSYAETVAEARGKKL